MPSSQERNDFDISAWGQIPLVEYFLLMETVSGFSFPFVPDNSINLSASVYAITQGKHRDCPVIHTVSFRRFGQIMHTLFSGLRDFTPGITFNSMWISHLWFRFTSLCASLNRNNRHARFSVREIWFMEDTTTISIGDPGDLEIVARDKRAYLLTSCYTY